MYSFRSATLWPLSFIVFFLLLSSCKKDKFESLSSDSSKSIFHSTNLPISIPEAKSFFEKLNLTPQSSYDGDSVKMLNIIIEPIWDEAYLVDPDKVGFQNE